MTEKISVIENDIQDRSSLAWKKLCDYIDKTASENGEEFLPAEELGWELFSQIHTLPETISKLKNVKNMILYGSKLKRIPPEIGEMEALENFVPYTSYDLHWFPYEITKCRKLVNSTVSTRALYGNKKNRLVFPLLDHNPVRYLGRTVNCSVCNKIMTYEQTNQFWISLWVGTDVLPLLANVCSEYCKNSLPEPPENYIKFPHKGGNTLPHILTEDERFDLEIEKEEEREGRAEEGI
ncbi:leucine-rich repeat domain-containing protein [Chryseobacterium arthrosphaerae]|uniref:leucine-rich repeat domain-containing protein n=1 Tax=Chryseobacterium arthrosphaerae TaxID=651561 RepID=UPI00157FA760|nr:leucine-rich repeat domain-containing protein [Chryseobacterium arthrosphaerae]